MASVIREYGDQKINNIGPTQQKEYSAAQFGAQEAQAMGQLGESVQHVGDIVAKRIDQENTSDTTAKMAKAHADLAIKLQDTIRTAQPGDKKVFENYQKEVDDTLSKIGEGATTATAREFYTKHSAAVKAQLGQTSAAGQAELAGVKAVQDYKVTLNSLSTATMADPTSAAMQRAVHAETVKNLVATGGMSRADGLKLEREGNQDIAKAAVRGWAALDPEYAKQKLKSGMFDTDLDADHKHALFGEIDQAIRGKDAEEERRKKMAKDLLEKQQTATQNDFLVKLNSGELSFDMIRDSNLQPFGSGSKEQFIELMKKKNSPEEKLKTDPVVFQQLFDRIHLPDGDPNKITDENDLNKYVANGLSFPDFNHLREETQGTKTEAGKVETDLKKNFIEAAKSQLTKSNPMLGIRDPSGDENYYKWYVSFQTEYKAKRTKGASPSELLDPKSPQFIGNSVPQFKKTTKQIMKELTTMNKPKAPPPPPVEGATQVYGTSTYKVVNGVWTKVKK